jgi:hypothetical protein
MTRINDRKAISLSDLEPHESSHVKGGQMLSLSKLSTSYQSKPNYEYELVGGATRLSYGPVAKK